jgi:hypothetical protein
MDEKLLKYREYQKEYHRDYYLKKRLENGLIDKKPFRKLKNTLAEFIDDDVKNKILGLEKELVHTREKHLQSMKLIIKILLKPANEIKSIANSINEKIENIEELKEFSPLEDKIDYYEYALQDLFSV